MIGVAEIGLVIELAVIVLVIVWVVRKIIDWNRR